MKACVEHIKSSCRDETTSAVDVKLRSGVMKSSALEMYTLPTKIKKNIPLKMTYSADDVQNFRRLVDLILLLMFLTENTLMIITYT